MMEQTQLMNRSQSEINDGCKFKRQDKWELKKQKKKTTLGDFDKMMFKKKAVQEILGPGKKIRGRKQGTFESYKRRIDDKVVEIEEKIKLLDESNDAKLIK